MRDVKRLFYGSVFCGILLWLFFFLITPIEVKNKLSFFTLSFITVSYICLLFGFISSEYVFKFNFCDKKFLNTLRKNHLNVLKLLISIIIISYVVRYFDLFYNRKVNFFQSISVNKANASNPENFSLLFNLLSLFRVLYFVPLIIYLENKFNNKKLLFICILLFILPFVEGYLRGSRRIVFESVVFFSIIWYVFKKINFKSLKLQASTLLVLLLLLSFSIFVVINRVGGNRDKAYSEIFYSQYNDFVPVKKEFIGFIQKKNFLSDIIFSEIHIGQYITHGVFEMDYMISTKPKHTYGVFNFYSYAKFLNKIGLPDIPLLKNPTKRITYITFFGGMYLDFGLFSFVCMFIFGAIQNRIFLLSSKNYIFIPLTIVFLFSNIFMLIFNFMRAQFIFIISVYFLFCFVLFCKRFCSRYS